MMSTANKQRSLRKLLINASAMNSGGSAQPIPSDALKHLKLACGFEGAPPFKDQRQRGKVKMPSVTADSYTNCEENKLGDKN